jgi:hypothetical protein
MEPQYNFSNMARGPFRRLPIVAGLVLRVPLHPSAAVAQIQSGVGGPADAQAQVAYAVSALGARRLLDGTAAVAVINLPSDRGEGGDDEAAFRHRLQRPFPDWITG